MTVVSFIIFQGGILSLSLCRLALDLWEWCLRRENFSSRGSHSRRRVLCGGFSLQGLIPSYSVGSESCRFFGPIYRMFSSPLELVLFASAFNFRLPKLLLSVPGCSGVENRRSVVFPGRVFDFTRFSLLSSPLDLGQVSPGTKQTFSW